MRFFSWVQGVIVGLSGFVGEVSTNNQFRVTDKDLFTSHSNTISANLTLGANRNHYSSGLVIIEDDVTVTIPDNTAWFIGD